MRLRNPFHSIRRYALINILTSGVEKVAQVENLPTIYDQGIIWMET